MCNWHRVADSLPPDDGSTYSELVIVLCGSNIPAIAILSYLTNGKPLEWELPRSGEHLPLEYVDMWASIEMPVQTGV